jgi:arsenite-transporting ATPase
MIFFTTGKGGVGKTTLSSATGLFFAQAGHRTAIVSIDPAHSLGDVFDLPGIQNPTSILPHLDLYEISLAEEIEMAWGEIHRYLVRLFASQGVEEWVAREVAYLPGLEEIFSLLAIKRLAAEYEILVVDAPPTGATLRFLNLPEAVEWYMRKLFPVERKVVEVIGPFAERLTGIPMPQRSILDDVEHLYEELKSLHKLLTDPETCHAQIVTTPQKVVLRESQRVVGYLALQGIFIARILVNRSDTVGSSVASSREEIERVFYPLPCAFFPDYPGEPLGISGISPLVEYFEEILQEKVARTPPLRWLFQDGESPTLRILYKPYPGETPRLELGRKGEDLIVTLGPLRRVIPLPLSLATRPVRKAYFTEAELVVEFA